MREKEEQEKKDIINEMENELEEMIEEGKDEENNNENIDVSKSILAKTMADFENYKKRVERDNARTMFYIKQDIIRKILPRVDDLERIIKNTPLDLQQNSLYEGIMSLHAKLLSDLEKLGVKQFSSIGEEVDPDKHEVITVLTEGNTIISDEFEKGYTLDGEILRHAKVIVG